MPYVQRAERDIIDPVITATPVETYSVGGLNYLITRLIMRHMGHPSYLGLCVAIGTLGCVALELYRRVGVPYEKEKCITNGDVLEYQPVGGGHDDTGGARLDGQPVLSTDQPAAPLSDTVCDTGWEGSVPGGV